MLELISKHTKKPTKKQDSKNRKMNLKAISSDKPLEQKKKKRISKKKEQD